MKARRLIAPVRNCCESLSSLFVSMRTPHVGFREAKKAGGRGELRQANSAGKSATQHRPGDEIQFSATPLTLTLSQREEGTSLPALMDHQKLKDKASDAFAKGKFSRAAELYAEYCSADPKDRQARLRMGDAWVKAGDREKAIGAYMSAAE